MKKQLRGAVVVLTGASSGIGRVTAQMFAARGAKLVLAARNRDALEQVVQLCARRGGEAIAVPTDIRDESQVQALCDAAVERFGKIDVWVNDAAVYMMGPLERVPTEQFRALFETNVIGTVNGIKAALTRFRQQGYGTLIGIGSVAGKAAYPLASAYCASKHAVHAIHQALRQELAGTNIHACLVAPATVDTPLFQHAANFTGREIRAMPPIYRPERVAAAIVRCAESPRREVLVGAMPRIMTLMQMLMPSLFERMQPKMVDRQHLGDAPAPDSTGNVEKTLAPYADEGGWKREQQGRGHHLPGEAPRPQLSGA